MYFLHIGFCFHRKYSQTYRKNDIIVTVCCVCLVMSFSFLVFPSALLSICFLITVALLVALCTCLESKESSNKHTYVIDENNGLTKVSVNRLRKIKKNGKNTFRRFTSTNIDVLKDNNMSNDRLPRRDAEGRYFNFSDGIDCKTRYDECKIEIILDPTNMKDDEMMSCKSTDSKNTFYSTYPLLRTMSATENFRSITSEDLVDA